MQPHLPLLLVLAILAAGCASPDPAGEPSAQDLAAGPDGQPLDGVSGAAIQPATRTYDADVHLALGDCSEVGSTSACVFNVGDPRQTGASANIAHVPFAGADGTILGGQVNFTWSSQAPTNDVLELRLTRLECDGEDCSTETIVVAQESTSPFTFELAGLGLVGSPSNPIGATVTRGQAADGVRASTFQDVHIAATVTYLPAQSA